MPIIIEELQYKISRASKHPLVHKDYDVSACYVRIIMNFGGLNSQSHGVHQNILITNGKTSKEAKYLLQTVLDVSEECYSHCELFPIYNLGQGACNSPGLCGCISSTAVPPSRWLPLRRSLVSPDSVNVFCLLHALRSRLPRY